MSVSTNFARVFGLSSVLATGLLISPVSAQTQNDTPSAQPSQDCALGNQDAQDGSGGQNSTAGFGGQDLSNKLADCDGVLTPPQAGDPELVKPAPNAGDTPVIPPKNLPDEQQNSDPDAQ